jgi:hypothetical protein
MDSHDPNKNGWRSVLHRYDERHVTHHEIGEKICGVQCDVSSLSDGGTICLDSLRAVFRLANSSTLPS